MITRDEIKIGEAAVTLGTTTHTLRHWEALELLSPPRGPSGHRAYDEHVLLQARLIQVLQRTGLSLEQIRTLSGSGGDDRLSLINGQRTEIQGSISLLQAADRFLEHIVSCRHPVISECSECAAMAARHDRLWSGVPTPRT